MGFPTANIRLEEGVTLKHGIYAVYAYVDGKKLQGAAYLGTRPTFDAGLPLLEIFLLDFDGNLYGKTLEIEFIAFVREDAKIPLRRKACRANGGGRGQGQGTSRPRRKRRRGFPIVPRVSKALQSAIVVALVVAGLAGAILFGMIAFGTSDPPPPLASINSAFENMDFSDLPAVERVPARGGGTIAFRRWNARPASDQEIPVIAIHGSSGSSVSLHALAKALSAEGMQVYAPDIRGHGETGRRGDIDYAGQLDDDLEDFVAAVQRFHPGKRPVLLGSSSGGGFALHAAASRFGGSFERVVLLSPMLGPQAPTVKDQGEAWARPFIPRYIGLSVLSGLGIHAFDHLPVIAFAIDPARASLLARHILIPSPQCLRHERLCSRPEECACSAAGFGWRQG